MFSNTNVMDVLGTPTKTIVFAEASLAFWSLPPILATQLSGWATMEVAEVIDAHYREHFQVHDAIVTIHDWSALSNHDPAARKLLQSLTREVQAKQRELIIYLGKGDTFVKKIAVTTAETISRFRRLPTELITDASAFEKRLHAMLATYRPEWLAGTRNSTDTPELLNGVRD